MPQSRRLAVIMFTDVVGYTALMGEDERRTLSILKKNKQLHRRFLRQFNGNFLKEMGDGILCSFNSVTDAVYCAGALVSKTENIEGLQLRIGVHLGEVIVEGKEIYGDGVNVASRIQGLADPDQILVSEAIYSNIKNKPDITYTNLGEHKLKNVVDPLKVYSIDIEGVPVETATPTRSVTKYIPWAIGAFLLILAATFLPNVLGPGRPGQNLAIAVLLFDDISPNGDQAHLGYGISDELLNTLCQQREVAVIAKTSSFRYQGKDMDLTEIGEELGVTHIVEGGIRTSGDRIRINVQLTDTRNNHSLWASSFDRTLGDILALEEEIADSLFNKIGLTLGFVSSKREVNPDAYQRYLEAKYLLESKEFQYETEDVMQAEERFQDAIRLDSTFALAFAGYAEVLLRTRRDLGGPVGSQAFQLRDSLALQMIRKAYALDPQKGYINSVFGTYHLWHGDIALAHMHYVKAVEIEPGKAVYLRDLASIQRMLGLFDEYDWLYRKALRLDPQNQAVKFEHAINLRISGQWDQAISHLRGILDLFPEHRAAFNALFHISCLKRDFGTADSLLNLTRQEHSKVAGFDLNMDIYYAAKNIPDSVTATYAEAYALLGRIDQVIKRYEQFYQQRPFHADGWRLASLDDESAEMDQEYRDLYRPLLDHPRFPDLMVELQRRYQQNLQRFIVKGSSILEH